MLTERIPIPPPRSLVILDQDAELTLAKLNNVLIAHWVGPSDTRNGDRLVNALRELAKDQPIGFVALVEPSSAAPDRQQRARLGQLVSELQVEAIATVIRGNALRRQFATAVLTSMLFFTNQKLSTRTQICTNERDAASWITLHVTSAPPLPELTRALTYLRV